MDVIINVKDIYGFPGFRANARARLHPLDPDGLIVTLKRRQKKRFAAAAGTLYAGFATAGHTRSGTWMARPGTFIWNLNTAGSIALGAKA